MKNNIDLETVKGFGDEWSRFNQALLPPQELQESFNQYFKVFPWNSLPKDAVGFDLGCGSGRWAKCVAPKVCRIHCIDASEAALAVAKRNLKEFANCEFHVASVADIPLPENSMDFGYSLGVFHHIPDTTAGIKSCVSKLKAGAPFLLYIYYAFDNRPAWFRVLWRASDFLRKLISRFPYPLRYALSQVIAVLIYYPFARFSLLLEIVGLNVEAFPLSAYRRRSFYTMRTDALDRFGTRLEKRFTAAQIQEMMEDSDLERIVFSDTVPYWCAVGYKKN
ncbi:class I SAM-dependent methyltransferase [Patescibacteria group bacterium]|nr:class I SAM-dependent methyltransferase [Patescibacteria group bacterium]MBU4069305.1 class I SAM-dependent methyltransferase [Pseudomonadota bacterium]